jgi:phospholipase C
MSDNSFNTVFGPSTPGALNLISGQTYGATPAAIPNQVSNSTMIGNARPVYDDCSVAEGGSTASMSGTNVGNLLNTKGITWGWFQGGFQPTSTTNGVAVCGSSHPNIGGTTVTDYIPHHEPFQYYQSTANPHHLPLTSTAMIGNQSFDAIAGSLGNLFDFSSNHQTAPLFLNPTTGN